VHSVKEHAARFIANDFDGVIVHFDPVHHRRGGRTRFKHADGIQGAIAGRVRDAAPSFSVSRCSAAMSFQRDVEAFAQGGSGKGLAQEANGSGLQRSGADALIGEGRYENERRIVTLGAHKR
jgi:hypothetical protein